MTTLHRNTIRATAERAVNNPGRSQFVRGWDNAKAVRLAARDELHTRGRDPDRVEVKALGDFHAFAVTVRHGEA